MLHLAIQAMYYGGNTRRLCSVLQTICLLLLGGISRWANLRSEGLNE